MTSVYRRTGVSLTEVLGTASVVGASPIGIVYGVDAARFVRLDNGTLKAFDGSQETKIDLTVPYEARIFDEHAELRWVHEKGGKGTAVIIADNQGSGLGGVSVSEGDGWTSEDPGWSDSLERRYLLWPTVKTDGTAETHSEWTRIGSARVGSMWIPGTFNADHVCLEVREYLAVGEDGNVSVVAERYVKLGDCQTEEDQEEE